MYKSLQMCRAIAGMLVALYHLGGAFGADKYFGAKTLEFVFTLGHHSVVFFFVLSGFIMVQAHHEDFGKPHRLLPYLKKRVVRVYPAYLLVLLSVYFTARLIPSLSHTVPHDIWLMMKTVLLAPQDRMAVGGTGAPVLIVAWSLQYEMAFYAVIACFILSRWLGWTVLAALLLNFADCHWRRECAFPQSFLASNFIIPFCFGAAVSWLSRTRLRMNDPMRVAMVAVSVLALFRFLDLAFGIDGFTAEGSLIYGAPSAVLIFSLIRAEQVGKIRVNNFWQLLGRSSYALYLIHFPLISLLVKVALAMGVHGSLEVGSAFVVIFVCCVVAAVSFHVLIEKPLTGRLLRSSANSSRMTATDGLQSQSPLRS